MKNSSNRYRKFFRPATIIFLIILSVFLAFLLILFFSFSNLSRQISEINENTLNMSEYISRFNNDFNRRNSELATAEILINNTNSLLSVVYYGTADTEELEGAKDFTAFSLFYKDKFYMITAGHCIEANGERYKNFRFMANDRDYFIPLELIDYKNDYTNNIDYAIFHHPLLIKAGLYPASPDESNEPRYILGNIHRDLNFIKKYGQSEQGESGSPVLNEDCHVLGVLIKSSGTYTPISEIIITLENNY